MIILQSSSRNDVGSVFLQKIYWFLLPFYAFLPFWFKAENYLTNTCVIFEPSRAYAFNENWILKNNKNCLRNTLVGDVLLILWWKIDGSFWRWSWGFFPFFVYHSIVNSFKVIEMILENQALVKNFSGGRRREMFRWHDRKLKIDGCSWMKNHY